MKKWVKMVKHILFWAAVLYGQIAILSGGEAFFPAGTPVFDRPGTDARQISALTEPCRVSGTPERIWFRNHPLARYADFYRVEHRGVTGYVSPEIFRDEQGKNRLDSPGSSGAGMLFICSLAILIFLLWYIIRLPAKRQDWRYFAAICAMVRIALLSFSICLAGNIYCNPADEPGYFAVGYDLLHGKIAGPWVYPVGYGTFFMIPWILLLHASSYWDLLVPMSWFGGFVLGPAALVLGFLLLRKLGISLNIAFATVLAWAVLPFVIHHAPDWEHQVFYSYFRLPPARNGFQYYMTMIGCGFNGMSDMSSTVLVLGILLAARCIPVRFRYLAGVSALFGLSCLVRLNNIFYAPVLAFFLLERFLSVLKSKRDWGCFILTGLAAYCAVAGIQLAVNFYQFGDVMTFPYSLHAPDRAPEDRPAAGFTLKTLCKGASLRYLLESNLAVMSCAAAGLIFLKDRRLRVLLALWSIPVILFFCGYSHTFCDPVRFIMPAFVPLLAAGCLAVSVRKKEVWRFLAFAALSLVLILLHSGVVLAVLLAGILLYGIMEGVPLLCRLSKSENSFQEKA